MYLSFPFSKASLHFRFRPDNQLTELFFQKISIWKLRIKGFVQIFLFERMFYANKRDHSKVNLLSAYLMGHNTKLALNNQRRDTQHNDTQYNDTQHNYTQPNNSHTRDCVLIC